MTTNSPFVAAGFKGRVARLGSADIRVAATLLGVEIAALMAVISVETNGSGFDWAGRPTILFEPHRFYRHLSGGDLRAAVQAGLAYPNWGEQPYPPTSDGNYARLIAAYVAAHQAARPVAVIQPAEERTADDLNAAELARMSAAT